MITYQDKTKDIPTLIKNRDLVQKRRRQIVDAAVVLFIKKGFHRTTTREIAQAAGVSIGGLYEYITSKEDILYLVCEAIHADVKKGVAEVLAKKGETEETLIEVIREYFRICYRMSDHILLIYQETRSLPQEWRKKILENELNITGIFVQVLVRLVETGKLPFMDERTIELLAHDISVLGHMWTFRRWFLSRHYSIEEYADLQASILMGKLFNPS